MVERLSGGGDTVSDINLAAYGKPDVVAHYQRASDLMPPERYLFGKYVKPGMAVLDIGVGGGRTSPHLARGAKRYLGLDYAHEMVAACRERFPDLEFAWGDATDLSDIADESFDVAIFSFNGLDSIPTDEGRIRALREMRRVTRPGGTVIVSSHNARHLIVYPLTAGVDIPHKLWRIALSGWRTLRMAPRHLLSGAVTRGHGYIRDPVHGGLFNHASTPESMARDAAAAGLRIVERAGAQHPKRLPAIMNAWDTYAMARA